MKKKVIWLTMDSDKAPYKKVMGYTFGDGIMGAYQDEESGLWVPHHVPSGLSVGLLTPLYKDAREYVNRLRAIKSFDWYATDRDDFDLHVNYSDLVKRVGQGTLSGKEFDKQIKILQAERLTSIMEDQIKKEEKHGN